MRIDYEKLRQSVTSGTLRIELEQELETGFREMVERGEHVPPASYLATKIAELIHEGAVDVDGELAFNIYQEVASACEAARERVLESEPDPN